MTDAKTIKYPYLPPGRQILYVPMTNPHMAAARDFAKSHSLDDDTPTAAVLLKNGKIIGLAANGSMFHKQHGCVRAKLKIPTGQKYELCEGCHPKNHSESRAIAAAKANGFDPQDSDLYLWGHWWCCKPCWDKMIAAGIKNVYLENDINFRA